MSIHPVMQEALDAGMAEMNRLAEQRRKELEKENNYANYWVKRDKEYPQWLRELNTGNP